MIAADSITIAPPKPIRIVRPDQPKPGPYDKLISDLLESYTQGRNTDAELAMLAIFERLEGDVRNPNHLVTGQQTHALITALSIFCRPDFVVTEDLAKAFLWHNPVIGNAMAAAGDNTTDAFVASLEGQRQQAFKSCVLLSPRANGDLRLTELMAVSPVLASAWLNQTYKTAFSGNVNTRCRDKLIKMSRSIGESYAFAKDVQEPYFLSSYLGDDDAERTIKSAINAAVKRVAPKFDNGEPANAVAVVSDLWMPGHSVYRSLKAYIEAIRGDYRMILVSTIRETSDLDATGFDEAIRLPYDGERLDVSPLENKGLEAVIYPDVGMTGSSIMLANMRLAPVQVMMTGHPASTFGGEIDYFISGKLVEENEHQANYSEKLVRLPGYGATHTKPTYEPKNPPKDFDGVLINCSWYGQKMTRPFLELVNRAIGMAGVEKVRLQIFAGGAATTRGGFGAFLRDVGEAITACEAIVYPHLDYPAYMTEMEKGDFAIDCSPWAGSNTVSDNLWLRKPVIALQGDRWFNRIGPAMLRSCGLGGLIAATEDRFAGLICDMVNFRHVRESFAADLAAVDLDAAIYAPTGADAFRHWLNGAVSACR